MKLRTVPTAALLISATLAAPTCKSPEKKKINAIEDAASAIVNLCKPILDSTTPTRTGTTWRVEKAGEHCQCSEVGETIECAHIVPLEGGSPYDLFSAGKSSRHTRIELSPKYVRFTQRSGAAEKVESGSALISYGDFWKDCLGENFASIGTVEDCESLFKGMRVKLQGLAK